MNKNLEDIFNLIKELNLKDPEYTVGTLNNNGSKLKSVFIFEKENEKISKEEIINLMMDYLFNTYNFKDYTIEAIELSELIYKISKKYIHD